MVIIGISNTYLMLFLTSVYININNNITDSINIKLCVTTYKVIRLIEAQYQVLLEMKIIKVIFSLFDKLSYNTIFIDILDALFFQMKS